MENRAFRQTLAGLSHPITLGAGLLLLLNDHLLRRLWPSWWTGKIGDAAWLVFAPFLAAALLAWLIPRRMKNHNAAVGVAAFSLTGAGFALAKTIPIFHRIAVDILEHLTGAPISLLRDPSDLLMLPALLVGWVIWRSGAAQNERHTSRGWVMLALGALATLANAPAPNTGIDCLITRNDGSIIATSTWSWHDEVFTSTDGGLTWESSTSVVDTDTECVGHTEIWQLSDPADAQVIYRFNPGTWIERSVDGGQTWKREIVFRGVEARFAYYKESREETWAARPGPLDAAIHEPTGHVIAAMGHEGLLVRISGDDWRWISINGYYREDINQVSQILEFLLFEFLLGLALAVMLLGTLALMAQKPKWAVFALAIIGWGLWGFAVIMSPAVSMTSYLSVVTVIAMAATGVFSFGWGIFGIVRAIRFSPRVLIPAGITAIIAALLFLLPYVLWTMGSIPQYSMAVVFAFLLSVTTLFTGGWNVRRSLADAGTDTAGARGTVLDEQDDA